MLSEVDGLALKENNLEAGRKPRLCYTRGAGQCGWDSGKLR